MSGGGRSASQVDDTDYNADAESVSTIGSTRSASVRTPDTPVNLSGIKSAVVYDVPSTGRHGPTRLHVIPAEIPRARKRLDTPSKSVEEQTANSAPHSLHTHPQSPTSSDEDLIEEQSWSWRRLKKKFRSYWQNSQTNTENQSPASSNESFTDGLPKPPLLPRQNSNPLGLLPAPPRPKALKPSKTSPSPLLHRATPFSEKNYDSVSCECPIRENYSL